MAGWVKRKKNAGRGIRGDYVGVCRSWVCNGKVGDYVDKLGRL